MDDNPQTLYSVGHSNHPLETFLDLLRAQDIEVLVDVRSQPYSRYVPHFNPEALKQSVPAAGLRYVYLGKELGGRPEGAEFYDPEGHVLYHRVAEAAGFLDGISKLERGTARNRVAMFCSEENPAGCHRRLLVARVLAERGMNILHIRADGRLQTEADVLAEEQGAQTALFDAEEVTEWRSIRSVLPARPPKASSQG